VAACVHVMPVCSVGAPVVSGVALVLWLCKATVQLCCCCTVALQSHSTRATPLTTGAPTERTGITRTHAATPPKIE